MQMKIQFSSRESHLENKLLLMAGPMFRSRWPIENKLIFGASLSHIMSGIFLFWFLFFLSPSLPPPLSYSLSLSISLLLSLSFFLYFCMSPIDPWHTLWLLDMCFHIIPKCTSNCVSVSISGFCAFFGLFFCPIPMCFSLYFFYFIFIIIL